MEAHAFSYMKAFSLETFTIDMYFMQTPDNTAK